VVMFRIYNGHDMRALFDIEDRLGTIWCHADKTG